MAIAKWPIEVAWEETDAKKQETHILKLDSGKSRSQLSWDTYLNMDNVLEWTLDWYNAFYAGVSKMKEFSLSQINTYEKVAKGQNV